MLRAIKGLYLGSLVFVSLFVSTNIVLAAAPTGVALNPDSIISITQDIGGFLYIAGGILGGIIVILSGYGYLTAGGDSSKIKSAKDMLRAGIIGILLIFGFGFIMNTVSKVASNPSGFFE